jgi:Ca2+-binding EF-hand superfamily protein
MMKTVLQSSLLVALLAAVPITTHAQPASAGGQAGAGGRPTAEQMDQGFTERFKKADTNGDGTISKSEAEAGMPMLARNFDAVDANKDGKLTSEEIRAAFSKGTFTQDMRARGDEMFKKADANNDGFLSEDEAARASPRMAQNFAQMDANKDGKLSRDEIRKYFESQRSAMGGKGPSKQ